MRVVIVGAGVGGLTLALSLHSAGVDAEVYESASELRPLGVGINILPHAVRELTELGLVSEIAARGIPTSTLMYANKFGQKIWSEPRGLAAGYNWPQYSIHRGILQMILLEAVNARLGPGAVTTNSTATSVDTARNEVTFLQGNKGTFTVRGDAIVAADGIHSALRRQFYPDEGAPIWNGRVLWRGVSRATPYLDGRTMFMAGHQNAKFVCYPVSPQDESNNTAVLNWVAELSFPREGGWRRNDWNRRGHLEDFLPKFENWHFPWLDVPAVIRASDAVFEYPLVDRDPVERWTFWRTTLLGDAAHPMYPIGSNGASQAILDARTLAYELATLGNVDAALARYEEARRPATSQLVLLNRRNGPEQVMQLAEERAPNGFTDVNDVLSRRELEEVAANYKRIAGFDRESLNSRPSLTPR